jgi:methyl-accepting chemotaxis protein
VVANEIKGLARQTAEATQEIKAKIEDIQHSTDETVGEMRQISEVINQVKYIRNQEQMDMHQEPPNA